MPAVQHSPPLLGFDDERRAVDAINDPRSPENRSCSLRRGSISRGVRSPGRRPTSLTRGTPVTARSRPRRRDISADRLAEKFPHLRDSSIPAPSLESLPQSPDETTPRNISEADDGSKFVFPPPPLEDDSSTLEPSSNPDSELELEYDDEFSVQSVADNLIHEINTMTSHLTPEMARAQEIRQGRKTLNLAVSTWQEEFANFKPEDFPLDDLKESVARAKQFKDEILGAQIDCKDVPDMHELLRDAANARSGYLGFIAAAFKEIRSRELHAEENAPSLSANTSTISSTTGNKTKADRVEKYMGPTIGDMRDLADRLDELFLDSPDSQFEFKSYQDRVKTTVKKVDKVKITAKELIDQALDCDLGSESTKLEDVYRILAKKEDLVTDKIQDLKTKYEISGDDKSHDVKPPTFSGENSDKGDYYSFKEDWDHYVALKGPSVADQVRLLTRTCLTGVARTACRHLDTVEEIFHLLKESFGNVSDLFALRVANLRRLGVCTGSNEQTRKWLVEVRSQLLYLRDLAMKHDLYEELYMHSIVGEVIENIPEDSLVEFQKMIFKLEGKIGGKRLLEQFIPFLDEMVTFYNKSHSFKLDRGVDPDKRRKPAHDVKKTATPPSKPAVKSKTFASVPNPTKPPSGGKATKPSKKPNSGVYVSKAYVAPSLKDCKLCNGKHTHIFYCDQFSGADILTNRIQIAQRVRACFRCLRMDSEVDVKDREGWEARHRPQCQSEWACSIEDCADRPKNRQFHFTLCKWHVEENKKIQPEFLKKLDPAQTKPGTSFFFNLPGLYNLNPISAPIISSVSDKKIHSDVDDPSIFMLQNYNVNGRSLLTFYDSGCMGSAMSDKAAVLLDSTCIRPGPTKMDVAGGKTILIEGGDEQFLLDLVENNERATFTALRMPHVTTKFPLWRISDAWNDIQLEYNSIKPNLEPLPPTPAKIGGDEVDLMIGIRYQKYFPVLLYTLPCGLGIFKSVIAAPRGEITILGGPHPAWRHATDLVGFLGVKSFFTAECRAFQAVTRNLHHLYHPVEHEPVDPLLDVLDDDLLLPDDKISDSCEAEHCEKHGDLDAWIIPPSWDTENTIYGLRQESQRFDFTEQFGTEVSYRCVRCRNCSKCRQGETLETVSLKEEQEQFLIDQSVTFLPEKQLLLAKLPFTSDPSVSLRPNRFTAEKILESQIRQLQKNEPARIDVLAAHEKLRSRAFVVPLTDLPPKIQSQLLDDQQTSYIIPWRSVWKATSLSTPCRMVFDASSKTPGGDSLNNILAKGENNLAQIPALFLRFRSKPGAVTCDLTMAYNQIKLDPSCYRFQQYLWKPDLNPEQPTIIMVVVTLIYGVKSSGNQLFAGLSQVADYCDVHYPEHSAGAQVLRSDGYVDDIIHAADDLSTAKSTAESLDFVLKTSNLSVKAYTFSGSPPAPEVSKDGIHVGVVGMLWDPEKDLVSIDIKELFFGKSKRGVLPEVVSGDIGEALRNNFTRRNLLGKVAGVYDPVGLVTPITSRLKLDLHDLCLENLDWDDPVPDSYLEKWISNLNDIQSIKELKFRRTVIPPDASSLEFDLIISSDASKSIAVASVHARVPLTSGGFSCQLLTAKSKIVRYSTIPRAELRAAVMSASLAHFAQFHLRDQISDSVYVTDSTIVLHWLNHDERPLETAVRNSVIEIRRLSDVKQWFHIEGSLNIADLGTRHADVSDLSDSSDWQNGKSWMCLPREQMPLKTIQDVNLSAEEKRSVSLETKTSVMFNDLPELVPRVSERYIYSNYIYDPNKSSWTSSVRIISYVIRFVSACKPSWSPSWFPPPAPTSPVSTEYPFILPDRPHLSDIELKRGENYYFLKATLEVKKFSPDKEYKDNFIMKNGIMHYVGRILDSQEINSPEDTMLDLTPLSFVKPIVDRYSPIAYSIMLHSHEAITHHRSATASLLESRYLSYILRGRDLANEVVKSCRFCIRNKTRIVEVEDGKLHQTRLTVAPVFYCCQVDIFGPLLAICEHQHRSTVKIYGLVFKDPASCAVAIYTMQNYSSSAFIQAYTRFASRYGHPSELRIDEGSQLLSACRNMELSIMDISDFLSINHQVGVKFSTCPVAGHNAHGMVERSIKEIKSLLNKVYGGLKLDILSTETCFSWIASELNNLPICIGSRVSDLDHVDLITPSRLILGRNNRRALSGYPRISTPSRLIEQMDKVYDVWWNVWRTEKLVDFIPQPSKWKKTTYQLKEGDIVIYLKSDAEHRLGDPVWRIARVQSVDVSEDGLARSAVLEYRNPSEKTFRTTRRSVRTVVVVHREDELDLYQILEQAAQHVPLSPDSDP